MSDLDIGEMPARISRVNLLVDNDHFYTAGDDTGRTVEKTCPWGSQAMCDQILSALRSVDYQPFTGSDSLLDPAAEIGDGITVGGIYSVLASSSILFDRLYTADISAPMADEVEDEYPYKSRLQRQEERKLAQVRSKITKTAEQIRLEVLNEMEGLSASIDVKLGEIQLEVSNEIEGLSSSIGIELDGITERVENAESGLSQTLRIAADGVTITNASGDTLTIDGGQIDASKINTAELDASKINTAELDASKIKVSDLQLAGAITFADLDASTQSSINGAINTANNAATAASGAASAAESAQSVVSGWIYEGTTLINGAQIQTGTVKATSLQGGSVSLLDYYENISGVITITPATTGAYAIDITSYEALRIYARSGNLFLQSGRTGLNISEGGINTVGADFYAVSSANTLGTSFAPWAAVYASTGEIITSDRDQKHGIEYGLERYDELFDLLRPVSYLLNNGESGRRHSGMIAQDVEAAMEECGLTGMDFGGFVKAPRKNDEGKTVAGEYDYSLRYEEFIPICIEQIQKLKQRVYELERGFTR